MIHAVVCDVYNELKLLPIRIQVPSEAGNSAVRTCNTFKFTTEQVSH